MDGDIAKRILAKFLKEKKLTGIALAYYLGLPHHNSKLPSNIKILNMEAKRADTAMGLDNTVRHLKRMVGNTSMPVSFMIKKIPSVYIVDIYFRWENYVDEHKLQIYQEFYPNKKQL